MLARLYAAVALRLGMSTAESHSDCNTVQSFLNKPRLQSPGTPSCGNLREIKMLMYKRIAPQQLCTSSASDENSVSLGWVSHQCMS